MKQNPRLRLVPPPPADDVGGADEAPFTEAELREAAALRGALDRGADPLASALSAAYRPASLADDDLEAILARALGEGDAPATRLERAAAESLRAALDRGGELADDAAILGDLRAAHRPAALAPARNEELIAGAIALAAAPRVVAPISTLRRALPATMAAVTGVLALAAGFALLVQTRSFAPLSPTAPRPEPSGLSEVAATALIRSRSTDDLFDPAEKFEIGHTSARIDRIASARSSDLRRNRFAAWGVR
jgi:hypothetical protein